MARPQGRTVVLERESQPGYHSTGRSAALFSETYGPEQVRALSRASREFLQRPPDGFAEHPILEPRGTLIIGDPRDPAALDAMQASLGEGAAVERWARERALATVPVLRPELTGEALHEPGAADIDVHTLHQGYLRGLKRAGGEVICGAEVASLERVADRWLAGTADGRQWRARRLLNAAGAWADRLAALAGLPGIGLVPKRRSAFVFAPPACLATAHWPLVLTGRQLVLQARCRPAAGQPGQRRPGAAARRGARGTGHRARHPRHRAEHPAGHPPAEPHLGRPAQLRARRRTGDRLGRPCHRLLLACRPGRLRHPERRRAAMRASLAGPGPAG
jgi:glycine/D-amino acid oxidase-like deaminating enzyme